jgi:hypothetical protein
MDLKRELDLHLTRRQLFGLGAKGIGVAALASLFKHEGFAFADNEATRDPKTGGLVGLPHHAPKVKRVIFLHQSGGPSQIETFDYKPSLEKLHGTELPDSIRHGQRITGMTSGQSAFPCVKSLFKFKQHGKSGTWVSELLPHTAKIVDDIACHQNDEYRRDQSRPGDHLHSNGISTAGPSQRGVLGQLRAGQRESESARLHRIAVDGARAQHRSAALFPPVVERIPAIVLSRRAVARRRDAGVIPGRPARREQTTRRQMLDAVGKLNKMKSESYGDPEIETRISQYEMAYRMQTSVPELMDLSKEPDSVFEMYGPESRKPGSYAANCLLARRLAERGRALHSAVSPRLGSAQRPPARSGAAMPGHGSADRRARQDLKQRGLLDDTLIIWGGEFGRTVYCQGKLTEANYGRDHHPRNFAMWVAGGGVKKGIAIGETDDYSYNIVSDPVSVFDLQATMLHLLGVDHKRLTYKFQGRDFRLTDVHGELIEKILA